MKGAIKAAMSYRARRTLLVPQEREISGRGGADDRQAPGIWLEDECLLVLPPATQIRRCSLVLSPA